MDSQRFRAFSFVDRIVSVEASGRVVGQFQLAHHLDRFPQALVAEAIGQLAAWQSMAQLQFQHRPVAALAGETLYHAEARPGDLLTLQVDLESCDSDAVAYCGEARCGEQLILQLNHCSGAMLPQEQFDDPSLVAGDFETLRGPGAEPGRLQQAPRVQPSAAEQQPDGSLLSALRVPDQADFFLDHFPRNPVFPATLLMQALSEMLVGAVARAGQQGPRLRAMRRVKVRSWIHPGDHVILKAEGFNPAEPSSPVKLTALSHGKVVASAMAELAVGAAPST